MPPIPLETLVKGIAILSLLAIVGIYGMGIYNHGKEAQALKDQPKVTQAVVGEIAAGVASGVSQGASQAETKRLTKAQDTRKVSSEAQEVLTHALQSPMEHPSGSPTAVPEGGPSGLSLGMGPEAPVAGIPDSIADAYLSGLQRVRDSGTSGPTAFHKCPGNAGTWLICS